MKKRYKKKLVKKKMTSDFCPLNFDFPKVNFNIGEFEFERVNLKGLLEDTVERFKSENKDENLKIGIWRDDVVNCEDYIVTWFKYKGHPKICVIFYIDSEGDIKDYIPKEGNTVKPSKVLKHKKDFPICRGNIEWAKRKTGPGWNADDPAWLYCIKDFEECIRR